MDIYCGNNELDPRLVNGEITLGTRYKCLKKGIGRGMHLPYDPSYQQPYKPIDTTRIYCGDKDQLPPSYDRMGNLVHCLQRGIGIGKRIRVEKELNPSTITFSPKSKSVMIVAIVAIVIGLSALAIAIYLLTQKHKDVKDVKDIKGAAYSIKTNTHNNNRKIGWIVLIFAMVLVGLGVFWIYKSKNRKGN